MSEAVLADAQFGMRRVLRPFSGFQAVYEGQAADVPIAMPGILDSGAGHEGFEPNIIAGLPVPLGSKVLLWIPTLPVLVDGSIQLNLAYRYRLIWRLRSLSAFQDRRVPYHSPSAAKSSGVQLIFAAQKTIIYGGQPTSTASADPPTVGPTALAQTTIDGLSSSSLIRRSPLAPPPLVGNALIQQGFSSPGTVSFNTLQVDAEGDELIVLVDKVSLDGSAVSAWTFGTEDFHFGQFFGGIPAGEFGIYVFTGAANSGTPRVPPPPPSDP